MPGGNKPTYDGSSLITNIRSKNFFNPHDVCVDNDENIYVPQWNSGKTYPLKLTRYNLMYLFEITNFFGRFHPLLVHLPIGFLIISLY